MKFDELRNDDKDLIKNSILCHSVTLTSEALECKDVMPKETYERDMKDADRLIYLVNVLNNKVNYDK